MVKNKNIKYFKMGFYILAISPLIFIISSLTFYIYYGLILNFWGISGINPNEFPAINIYSYIIMYSWLITFFSIAFFILLLILILSQNGFKPLKRNILINSALYIISVIIVFSKVFEFAMD